MISNLDHEIKRFVKEIKRKLCCTSETKTKLTDGIVQEILERYAEQDGFSYDSLLEDFGSPDDIATELQDSIDPEEVKFVKKRKKVIGVVIGVFIVIALVVLGCFTWKLLLDQQAWAIKQIHEL